MNSLTGSSEHVRDARVDSDDTALPEIVEIKWTGVYRLLGTFSGEFKSMPKKVGLVCQHLEHISVRALDQYQQIIRAYVRQREGVYALYKKRRLYYVGLASDLKWRLGAHLKDRHKEKWDSFSVYLTVNDRKRVSLPS